MSMLILAALMAATPTNDTVARFEGGKTLEEIAEESPWANMAPMPHIIRTAPPVPYFKLIHPDSIWVNPDISAKDCFSQVGDSAHWCMMAAMYNKINQTVKAGDSIVQEEVR